MRAGCSASTFILVAAWEQSLHPGSPGHSLANREGPVKAEIAVRTTGLLTAGRNPGDRTDPACQLLTTDYNNATSEGQIPTARRTVAQALSPGRVFFVIGAPTGHSH